MRKLFLVGVLVPLLASATVCRYCSGTKFRTVPEVCGKCEGTGVYYGNFQKVACPYCDRAKGLARSVGRGVVVPSSGKVVRRVPCDRCSHAKVREVVITSDQLEELRNSNSVTVVGWRIVVRDGK